MVNPTARARGIFPCRLDGLILHVTGELVVQVELLVADLKRRRMDDSLGKQRLHYPGFGVGETDKGFL